MSGQSWTPAPKLGIVPLHPMTFGTILGKAFAALRHNPKVLFGFAVVVQVLVLLAATAVILVTVVATFSRLETVSPSSPDFGPLLAGSVAWSIVVSFLVGLASTAFTTLVQGVVAADVGFAAVGEKAPLGKLWRRMRPALWRLFGFAALSILFGFVVIGVIFGVGFGLGAGLVAIDPALVAFAVLLALGLGLASIPLAIWLGTKLLLVPSVLVLERAGFREALVRSWRLTRGRFWVAFGVIALISVIMGLAAQVVSIPGSLISSMLSVVIAPTGDLEAAGVVAMIAAMVLPQILVLILQAVTTVVICTGAVLVYIDCRMRYEGLDQDLLAYFERRDRGTSPELLPDPFTVDPARAVSKTPPPRPAPAPGYGPPPPGYAPQPPPSAAPQTSPYAPQPPYAPPPAAAPPAAPPASDAPPAWTAPGSDRR